MRRRRSRGLHDPLRLHSCPPCHGSLRLRLHNLSPPPLPIAPTPLRDRPLLQLAGLQAELLEVHLLFIYTCDATCWWDMSPGSTHPFGCCGENSLPASTRSAAWLRGVIRYPRKQQASSRGIQADRPGGLSLTEHKRSPSTRNSSSGKGAAC